MNIHKLDKEYMRDKPNSEDLSAQLRCPAGAEARLVGENMYQSNSNMIFETINVLNIRPHAKVFEIGFGSGMHLSYLFEKEDTLIYEGIDISEAMVEEANRNNSSLVKLGKATFRHTIESQSLSLPDSFFDYCFSVNTIYFWDNPQIYFDEIYHILSKGGVVAISFIAKSFGTKLPFTKTGFTFYEIYEVEAFLYNSGFINIQSTTLTENAISKDGQKVTRPFIIVTATKDQH